MSTDLPDQDSTLREYLQQRAPSGGERERTVAIYHAVRNIPYGSTGERDPLQVIARNVGSCSGKHILLRDLLRVLDIEAKVVTMLTHFSFGIPVHPSMPVRLQRMLRSTQPIVDFHHYVRVRRGRIWIGLDATWHDALARYDFPVNTNWTGNKDTKLAATPIREFIAEEDVAGQKLRLLGTLEPHVRARRGEFFRLLTEWISREVGAERSTGNPPAGSKVARPRRTRAAEPPR